MEYNTETDSTNPQKISINNELITKIDKARLSGLIDTIFKTEYKYVYYLQNKR